MPHTVTHSYVRGFGFTLIELIITLGIALILLITVIPSFRTLTVKNLQASEINSFVHHCHLARSLSISRETHHILCPSSNGESCTNVADWSDGYILYEDLNRNRSRDQNELLQGVHQPIQGMSIGIDSSRHRRYVVYRGDGRPSGYNLTLTFCDPDNLIPPKAVIVSNLGRVRVSKTRSDGSQLSCSGEI
ncbi:MAG: GspH/FimT family pseudopilin [Candidatus Thiodiazotropha sp.]